MLNKVTLLEKSYKYGEFNRSFNADFRSTPPPLKDEDILWVFNSDILALAESDAEIAELEEAVLDSWKAGYSA